MLTVLTGLIHVKVPRFL